MTNGKFKRGLVVLVPMIVIGLSIYLLQPKPVGPVVAMPALTTEESKKAVTSELRKE